MSPQVQLHLKKQLEWNLKVLPAHHLLLLLSSFHHFQMELNKELLFQVIELILYRLNQNRNNLPAEI